MGKSATAEIRERGEITIPKKIRESHHLEAGQQVEFVPFGETLLMTPKYLELKEARRQIQAILKRSKSSVSHVLKGLDESREEVYQKHYGRRLNGKK